MAATQTRCVHEAMAEVTRSERRHRTFAGLWPGIGQREDQPCKTSSQCSSGPSSWIMYTESGCCTRDGRLRRPSQTSRCRRRGADLRGAFLDSCFQRARSSDRRVPARSNNAWLPSDLAASWRCSNCDQLWSLIRERHEHLREASASAFGIRNVDRRDPPSLRNLDTRGGLDVSIGFS